MLRMIASLCFSAVLALTSVTMAVSRADAAMPDGTLIEMVLCTTEGEARVYLDGQGQPVLPHHHCPDCVAGMAGMVAQPFGLGEWVVLAQVLRFDDAPAMARPFRALSHVARAPPDLV